MRAQRLHKRCASLAPRSLAPRCRVPSAGVRAACAGHCCTARTDRGDGPLADETYQWGATDKSVLDRNVFSALSPDSGYKDEK